MTVRRRELIRYFEENGFYLRRERQAFHLHQWQGRRSGEAAALLDRIVANQLCRQAGLKAKF